ASSAYSFNGTSDRIEVAHTASQTFTNAVSVSLWMNAPDYSAITSDSRTPLCKQRTATQSGFGFETVDNLNTCCGAQFYVRGSTLLGYEHPDSLPINKWVHLVGTYDGDTLRVYQDNVLLGSRA